MVEVLSFGQLNKLFVWICDSFDLLHRNRAFDKSTLYHFRIDYVINSFKMQDAGLTFVFEEVLVFLILSNLLRLLH